MTALAGPVRLREMTTADVPAAHGLSRAAGWNQSEDEWRLLLELNPVRFVAAVADTRVVGTGGAACYGDALAWICMILVDPQWRGRGLGGAIVEAVLDRVGPRMARVGLDATPAGRPVYARLGFEDAYALTRLQAPADAPAPRAPSAEVGPLEAADLEPLLKWDRAVFGADRSGVLRWLHTRTGGWRVRSADGLVAYAFLRDGQHSRQVGPVVARDEEGAAAMVAAALAGRGGRPLIIDVPDRAGGWRARLEAMGFCAQRPLVRMFRRGAPGGNAAEQWAILGPELG